MGKTLQSRSLELAEERLLNLVTIDASLDLGNGLTVEAFKAKIEEYRVALNAYNSFKAELDGQKALLKTQEKGLRDTTELMLLAVATKFGKNSPEYAKAGGVRKVDRKRAKRKPLLEKTEQTAIAS